MTAKQSKKQELDLLQAVEKIVELAKDSQLSKDFLSNTCQKLLT